MRCEIRYLSEFDIYKAISKAASMKTTLIIEDSILKKAKEQAAARDTTVSELVNKSLRAYLTPTPSAVGVDRSFSMPVYGHNLAEGAGANPEQLAALRDDGR
jgi:hypothetical protein